MHACMHLLTIIIIITFIENEVDGEGFLLLTDEDIGKMVKPLGIQRKLIAKRNICSVTVRIRQLIPLLPVTSCI